MEDPDDEDARLGGVTSAAAREATGRGWPEWLEVLDAAGAGGWDHKQTVAYLAREHPDVSPWWQQSVTVAYEQARGKRVLGETADAGFQIGVRRTVEAGLQEVWDLLVSRPELWLGEGADVDLAPGARYDVPRREEAGARGEIRVVKPGDRIRLTWQSEGWDRHATLQLTLSRTPTGKTTIGAHLERLPDATAREEMRERLRRILGRLAEEL